MALILPILKFEKQHIVAFTLLLLRICRGMPIMLFLHWLIGFLFNLISGALQNNLTIFENVRFHKPTLLQCHQETCQKCFCSISLLSLSPRILLLSHLQWGIPFQASPLLRPTPSYARFDAMLSELKKIYFIISILFRVLMFLNAPTFKVSSLLLQVLLSNKRFRAIY
jgi:hypothetical protein